MNKIVLALIIAATVAPAAAETSVETKANSPACKIARKKMADAYVAKAPQATQDRLENKYACACGVIFPSYGPTCRK
jgi:hypothetical protein